MTLRDKDDAIERSRHADDLTSNSLPWHTRPQSKVVAGAAIIGLVMVAALYVLTQHFGAPGTSAEWTFVVFGVAFACGLATSTALRLLRSNVSFTQEDDPLEQPLSRRAFGSSSARVATHSDLDYAERQLLEAIERRGEITPIRAALETTLTVSEADKLLSELAYQGHLDVRVEEGKLIYSL